MKKASERLLISATALAAIALLVSCRQSSKTIESSAAGTVATPAELAAFSRLPDRMVADAGAPTDAQVSLGRALYYDNQLSANHNVSCNSCHPLNAYGADGRARSFGDHGQLGGRNAPTVYNAAGHIAQFWDGRAPTVEEQAKGPILNPAEMGMPDPNAVLAHLRESPTYRAAFQRAFPGRGDPITYDNVGRAIGAFERGLVTPARWDAFLAGDSSAMTATELRGLKTFVAVGCTSCHNGAYVGGNSYQKLGARTPWPTTSDSGRITVTKNPGDMQVFKVAALRNVSKTSPYFHDGSVATLHEAITLMAAHQLGRDLNEQQIQDITAWLDALTGELPAAYIAYPPLPKTPR